MRANESGAAGIPPGVGACAQHSPVLKLDRSWPVGSKLASGKGIGNGSTGGSGGSEAAAGSAAAAAVQVGPTWLATNPSLNPQRETSWKRMPPGWPASAQRSMDAGNVLGFVICIDTRLSRIPFPL